MQVTEFKSYAIHPLRLPEGRVADAVLETHAGTWLAQAVPSTADDPALFATPLRDALGHLFHAHADWREQIIEQEDAVGEPARPTAWENSSEETTVEGEPLVGLRHVPA